MVQGSTQRALTDPRSVGAPTARLIHRVSRADSAERAAEIRSVATNLTLKEKPT